MARIRSVHPGLFTDEAWFESSFGARIMLIGLLTEADDQGVFEWRPITLKMRLFPADNVDTKTILAELATVGWIHQFEESGKQYGAIRNFCKWQRPKSPQDVHPCPADIAEFCKRSERERREEKSSDRGTALGKILLDRQSGSCFYCEREITFYRKKPNSLEIDHRIPISRGGGDSVENLVASCRQCNSLKANLTDEEFRKKFAASELRERHDSRLAKPLSQLPKVVSDDGSRLAKNANGISHPQREDGGWRMEDGEEKKEIQKRAPKRASRLDGDFSPSDTMRSFARERGLTDREIALEGEKIRDWSLSSPAGAKLDWEAAWRNWIKGVKRPALELAVPIYRPI